jgi:hypothetical protein
MIQIQRFGWAPLIIAFAISSTAMPAAAQFETRFQFATNVALPAS